LIAELKVPKRYNLLSSVHSWIYPDIQPVPERTGPTYFARIYEIDEVRVPVIIEQQNPGGKVHIKCSSGSVSEERLLAKLVEVLGLKVSMSAALRVIERDPLLSHIASSVAGIQPYLSPSVYEALLKTIIQQQISYRAANILTRTMVLELSERVNYEGFDLFSFPTPADIMACGLEGLRAFGLGYKAEYVYGISKLVDNEELELEELKGKSFGELLEILKPIRGIGDWTVRTLAIAGLGDYTVFPYDDLGVRNLMGRLYKNNAERMTSKEVEDFAQGWKKEWPLVLYLLMSADVLGLLGQQGRQQMHKRS
jgi:DNA-3-methyladenine glycosylase II